MNDQRCEHCKYADRMRCYGSSESSMIRCTSHHMWVGTTDRRACFMDPAIDTLRDALMKSKEANGKK